MRGDTSETAEMDLVVESKEKIADEVVKLVLARADGRELPRWEPGAHIDVHLPNGIERQYSLCGHGENRRVYEIAVLRESDGRGGSACVHEDVVEGDTLHVRGPRNQFPLAESPRYTFIAGGIGITPILPMIRRAAEAGAQWDLLYGGRSRSSMAFRDELERHGAHVEVCPEDERGKLDLEAKLGTPNPDTVVYCCGPEPLLQAVEGQCASWQPGSLHLERFSPRADLPAGGEAFTVELAHSGAELRVPAEYSIVDALEEAGYEVETSCQEGTCGTCETAVLAGEPEHRDSILTEEEMAQNDTMFICVSRSRSATLRLDR